MMLSEKIKYVVYMHTSCNFFSTLLIYPYAHTMDMDTHTITIIDFNTNALDDVADQTRKASLQIHKCIVNREGCYS